jgi:quinol monooxygenase YgiN
VSHVIVTAVFSPKDGAKDDLIAALSAAIPAVHAEDGCELYAIHDAEDGTIVMIEKWSSRELLDAHSAGAAVDALRALIAPHLADLVVTVMSPLPAGTAAQGAL